MLIGRIPLCVEASFRPHFHFRHWLRRKAAVFFLIFHLLLKDSGKSIWFLALTWIHTHTYTRYWCVWMCVRVYSCIKQQLLKLFFFSACLTDHKSCSALRLFFLGWKSIAEVLLWNMFSLERKNNNNNNHNNSKQRSIVQVVKHRKVNCTSFTSQKNKSKKQSQINARKLNAWKWHKCHLRKWINFIEQFITRENSFKIYLKIGR